MLQSQIIPCISGIARGWEQVWGSRIDARINDVMVMLKTDSELVVDRQIP